MQQTLTDQAILNLAAETLSFDGHDEHNFGITGEVAFARALIAAHEAAQPAATDAQKLAQAIADAGARVGMYNGAVGLSGPQLLMILDDMAEQCERDQAALADKDAEIAALKAANLKLEALCDTTYVAQGADAYSHACSEMEAWQAKRRKAGKEVGTEGSLCDGMGWVYERLAATEAEIAALRKDAERLTAVADEYDAWIRWMDAGNGSYGEFYAHYSEAIAQTVQPTDKQALDMILAHAVPGKVVQP